MATLGFKGKELVRNYHLSVPYHELIPDKNKSLTDKLSLHDNLIIHGDNLLSLKALLPNYAGKVKCIYIDPPYNTGNEKWIYNDNVNSPMMKEWLGKVVDKDDLTRHDKWLCMMMPRLKLLRDLLSQNGIIFVSIDNNELHHLVCLMNEVFDASNYITTIANINNPKGRSDDKYIPTAHEYLVVYKNDGELKLYGWPPEDKVLRRYRKVDKNGKKWREIDLRKTGEGDRRVDRPNMFYYFLYNKITNELMPTNDENIPEGFKQIKPTREDGAEGRWRWGIDTAKKNISRLYARYMPNRKTWSIFEMDYLDPNEVIKPTTAWTKKDFNSERGTEQFIELGFSKEDFPKPKPVGLVRHILQFCTAGDDIVLDSFSGSGTTAQATLALNKDDGGKRKFILVECENYADTITAERVRRVINGVKGAKDENVRQGLGGTFSYYDLGKPIDTERILTGKDLPLFTEMARYIFYTATGEEFKENGIKDDIGLIGENKEFLVYLLYKPDMEYLKSTALTLERAEALGNFMGKKRLVFAPAKYLDQEQLERLHIDFAQLPLEIYQRR